MGNIYLLESRFHAGNDTLDRRLRRNGMLLEVASRGYMRKSQRNPRPMSWHRSRLRHIASHDHGRMRNRGSVGETIGKGRPEPSLERERSDRESSGRGRPVLT
jgi:hypothetical protein